MIPNCKLASEVRGIHENLPFVSNLNRSNVENATIFEVEGPDYIIVSQVARSSCTVRVVYLYIIKTLHTHTHTHTHNSELFSGGCLFPWWPGFS